ncbi:hypothetical protein, partial [Staphylococcus capitis]|uniref:hypothetical protein n=1 Tax=Staphylococcus capitis TaxID=29388 RepID=UPI001C92D886
KDKEMRREVSSVTQEVKVIIKVKKKQVEKRNDDVNRVVEKKEVVKRIIENKNRNEIVIVGIVVMNVFKKTRVK